MIVFFLLENIKTAMKGLRPLRDLLVGPKIIGWSRLKARCLMLKEYSFCSRIRPEVLSGCDYTGSNKKCV